MICLKKNFFKQKFVEIRFQADESTSTKSERTTLSRTHRETLQKETTTTTSSTATDSSIESNNQQNKYKPVHLDNIPLPTTGGAVEGKSILIFIIKLINKNSREICL